MLLRPGDTLVLYSDGVLDAEGHEDRFGPERLRMAVETATSADDAVTRVEQALASFQVGSQTDDTAILAVQRIGPPHTTVYSHTSDRGARPAAASERPAG